MRRRTLFFLPDDTELGELSQELELHLQKIIDRLYRPIDRLYRLRCQPLRMEYTQANSLPKEQVSRTKQMKSQLVLDHTDIGKLSMETLSSVLSL